MAEKLTSYNKKMHDFLQNNWKFVNEIWKKIGFDEAVIEKRNNDLLNVLCEALDDVRFGEIDLMNNIIDNCDKYKQKISDLVERLRLDEEKYKVNLDSDTSTSDTDDNNKEKKTLLDEEKYYKSLYEQIEKIKHERQLKLKELKSKEHELCDLLDETSYLIADTSAIPESELENLENHIVKLAMEKQKRISLIKQYREDIVSLSNEYEIDLNLDESAIDDILNTSTHDDLLLIDNEFIEKIKESYEKLIKERDLLVKQIDDLRSKIETIWHKLNISNHLMTELIQSCTSYNKTVLNKLNEEYERCLAIKQENMGNYIKAKRAEIESLWQTCYMSKEERDQFAEFSSVDFNDDLLDRHEIYLTVLKEQYEKNKNIYELFKSWQHLWSNYVEFEQQYSDPNRFKQRNYSALFEERERRRYQSELPKIEANIQQQLNQHDIKNVQVYGVNLTDYIKDTRTSYTQHKEDMRKERQIKKELDIKQEAHFGTMTRPLTPQNRKHKLVASSASASSTSNLLRNNATNITSLSTNKLPNTSKSTTISLSSSGKRSQMVLKTSGNKENIVKRSLHFNHNQHQSPNSPSTPKNKHMRLEQIKQFSTRTITISPSKATIASTTTTHQQHKLTTTNNQKRSSIKSLNEKFKRRSKRPTISNTTKKLITNNSIQTDSNDSGNGGSGTSTEHHHHSKIPKIVIQDFELENHDLADFEYDDLDDNEQIDFHNNDIISSTLLEN